MVLLIFNTAYIHNILKIKKICCGSIIFTDIIVQIEISKYIYIKDIIFDLSKKYDKSYRTIYNQLWNFYQDYKYDIYEIIKIDDYNCKIKILAVIKYFKNVIYTNSKKLI